jgi:hypothetical protein
MPTGSRTAGPARLAADPASCGPLSSAAFAPASALAVPDHLATALRPLAHGAAWLRLRADAPRPREQVTAFRADGTVVPLTEWGSEAMLRWIAADNPDAAWDTELALDLATGLIHPWTHAQLGTAAPAGA